MLWVAITALLAVCYADKLDRTYLPPSSAQTAGGSPGSIQTPFLTIKAQGNQGLGGLPQGGFENEYDGVVVEAAAAGTRTNEPVASGLGGPRNTYGSSNSKVGAAAFKEAQTNQGFGQSATFQRPSQGFTGQQNAQFGQQNQGFGGQNSFQPESNQGPNGQQPAQFGQLNQDFSGQSFQGTGNNQLENSPGQFSNTAPQRPERPQASADRNANILRYESEVDTDRYNYAFETDNGIIAEENGVNNNGIQAQGGFSYTGDDGQVYSVTYTADEGGYQPKGSHLPTPPPIPEEILKALEKNAQDEAAGIVDDGSYNAQKYNVGSGYTQSEIDSGKYNGSPTRFGSRPGFNNPSGSFANYEQSTSSQQSNNPSFDNSAPDPESNSNPSYQFESQSGQLTQPSGNNFAFNNEYSPANNRFQNGKPALNKPQVPSNTFDKLVEPSTQGEDQGQDTPTKPESNIAPFGISQGGNKRPAFGSFNQNRPSTTFGQKTDSASYQQNRQPFGRPQQTVSPQVGFSQTTPQPAGSTQPAGQDFSNTESNDYFASQSNSQQLQGTFNQQRPSNFNAFSGSSTNNNEYLPPYNQFGQNSRPQAPTSGSQFNKPSFATRPPGFPSQPSQQINGFQKDSQIPGRFPSSFRQPSRFGSPNNGFEKAPTPPPDTMLTTPFESSEQDSTTPSDSVPSSFSRVEAEAQKEQLANLQSSTSTSSASASSFASNLQKYQTLPQSTEQNNRRPSFGSNVSSFNQNRLPSVQLASTAAGPSFNQPQYQGDDDSYYYNQPSQSFNTPIIQSQGNRFPSAPSNQFNQPSGSNFANQQNAGFIPTTTVTYPRPPTVAPTVPTSSTQKDLGLGPIPQAGGVTDATASSFTSETSSNTQGQVNTPPRPTFGFPANRPNSVQEPSEPEKSEGGASVASQQYQGEIYEYKKPVMTLPAQPEKDTASQAANSFAGSTSQSQFPVRNQFESQASESGSQSQTQSGQDREPCCKRPTGRPSVFPVSSGSQNVAAEPTNDDREKPEKLIQGFNPNNYQPSSNFAGSGENFGGSRKPPSFDAQTGYHY